MDEVGLVSSWTPSALTTGLIHHAFLCDSVTAIILKRFLFLLLKALHVFVFASPVIKAFRSPTTVGNLSVLHIASYSKL